MGVQVSKWNEGFERPILSLWLTRNEWRMAFMYGWIATEFRCYGLEGMSEEEIEQAIPSYGVQILWAVRKLARYHGIEYKGLRVEEDGRVVLTSEEPIDLPNMLYLDRLARGKFPGVLLDIPEGREPRGMLPDFIAWIESGEPKNLDVEPAKRALSLVTDDLMRMKREIDPETRKLAEQTVTEMMESAGLHRRDKVQRNDN